MPLDLNNIHLQQSYYSHPPFSRVLGRKLFLLHMVTFIWCLKNAIRCREEKDNAPWTYFILVSSSISLFSSRLASTTCFLLSDNELKLLQIELAPQNNELSVQHANRVAFKQLSQRTYERAVTESVPNKSLRDIIPDAFWRSVQSRG